MTVRTQTKNATSKKPPYPDWVVYDPTSADLDIVDTYGMPAAKVDILTANSALVVDIRGDGTTTTVTVPTVANGFRVPYTIDGQVAKIVKSGSTTTSIVIYLPEVRRSV